MSTPSPQETQVFYNATFITLDPLCPRAEALAVKGDKILGVGSLEEMLALVPPRAARHNLEGQVVVPGFNDSHMHLLHWGLSQEGLDLSSARSLEELLELARGFIRNNPKREGILGRGWNEENFSEKTLPQRTDLDRISTQQPLVFTRVCGHISAVNSLALQKAGITAATPDPAGGTIDRDLSGEPSGILRENAQGLLKNLIPKPTPADLRRILTTAVQAAAALGLTTVQSNDLQGTSSWEGLLGIYGQLAAEGQLPLRLNLQAAMATPAQIRAYSQVRENYAKPNPYLTLGPLKLFADGSLGGRTAALTHPYSDDPHNCGLPLYTQKELDEVVLLAARADWQVAVHAIGDRAIDMVLHSYEQTRQACPLWRTRPRLIHCQITRSDQLQRLAKLGIVADIQPIFVPTDLHFVEERVGEKRAAWAYAWKTMHHLGIRTAGGSDCPVESCNPLWGMHAAITRQDPLGRPQGGWHPQECLTPEEALALFTTGSAYAAQEESWKGSLSRGKFADFVVLPEDPTRIPPEQLLSMRVRATYVGGRRVYP